MVTFAVGQAVQVTDPMADREYLLNFTGTVMAILDTDVAAVQMDQDVTMYYMGSLGWPNTITLEAEECMEITR